jgi:hypothetical protein
MKVNLMEVNKEFLEEREVIEVNNQTTIQTIINAGNLSIWPKKYYQKEHDARNGKL